MEAITTTYTTADVAYIRQNYFTLEELCADREETPEQVQALIQAELLPRPAYTLDNGSEWFPAGYFHLADEARGPERLPERFTAAIVQLGGSKELADEVWGEYLSGGLFWCIRDVTPTSIMRKSQLVESLNELLEQPKPDDTAWRAALRRDVWALDAIEREFAPDYDREGGAGIHGRFGVLPTRDRLISAPRATYPDIFAASRP